MFHICRPQGQIVSYANAPALCSNVGEYQTVTISYTATEDDATGASFTIVGSYSGSTGFMRITGTSVRLTALPPPSISMRARSKQRRSSIAPGVASQAD